MKNLELKMDLYHLTKNKLNKKIWFHTHETLCVKNNNNIRHIVHIKVYSKIKDEE